jgi:hypothetical protein
MAWMMHRAGRRATEPATGSAPSSLERRLLPWAEDHELDFIT